MTSSDAEPPALREIVERATQEINDPDSHYCQSWLVEELVAALLAAEQELARWKASFTDHVYVRSDEYMAFHDRLRAAEGRESSLGEALKAEVQVRLEAEDRALKADARAREAEHHANTWSDMANGFGEQLAAALKERDEAQAKATLGEPVSQPHALAETHIDRECRLLGHEWSGEDASGTPLCVHCGAEGVKR